MHMHLTNGEKGCILQYDEKHRRDVPIPESAPCIREHQHVRRQPSACGDVQHISKGSAHGALAMDGMGEPRS